MRSPHIAGIVDALPNRMRETLDLLLQGRSVKEVAAAMGISPNSVHTYVKQLYRRLSVRSRAELLVLLLSPPDGAPRYRPIDIDAATCESSIPR